MVNAQYRVVTHWNCSLHLLKLKIRVIYHFIQQYSVLLSNEKRVNYKNSTTV